MNILIIEGSWKGRVRVGFKSLERSLTHIYTQIRLEWDFNLKLKIYKYNKHINYYY